eukprot:6910060-Pyramimonas_sp.AAC.1
MGSAIPYLLSHCVSDTSDCLDRRLLSCRKSWPAVFAGTLNYTRKISEARNRRTYLDLALVADTKNYPCNVDVHNKAQEQARQST